MSICFVGPVSPPVHGFSEISQRMLLALRVNYQVVVFDVTPKNNPLEFIFTWWRFVIFLIYKKPRVLYLAFSGGHRQWIDLAFLLVARLRGIPIFVHHHSFSYLTERRLSAIFCIRFLLRSTHIVLCSCMGEKLIKRYSIGAANIRVLSNVAFLKEIKQPKHMNTESLSSSLRVGFLSNITAKKGIFEFFSVLSEAESYGLSLQGVIAGPVDTSVKESFDNSLASSRNVKHIGPVYGVDKEAFFSSIDILFFPTRYPNEAEPVTILEALGHGVPVIAFSRGCIDGMVPASAGAVFPYSKEFVVQTIEALRCLAKSPLELAKARHAARLAFESQQSSNRATLERLVTEMGGMPANKHIPV